MLAVGVDTIGHVDLLGFNCLLLQAPDALRPFDLHRKGTILSEGAGALLLEPLEEARRRGADVLAEVAGCGLSCDADASFQTPVSDVRSLLVAGRAALDDAAMNAEQIDYVSAHGSGTKLNDARETCFVKALLGPRAMRVTMSSIKSMLGHAQGAAASFEAIASVLSLQHAVLYPTTNYETPDPQCDIDCVANEARDCPVNVIMSNAFGFGGNNSVVLFKKWRGR
jgi:3-oxoacyl-[acyl-carrier-protein] synthase II